MSLAMKRIIMVFMGLLAACMIWPCLLTVQYLQPLFLGFRSFTLTQGVVLGVFFGAIFGSFEGIVVSSRKKAFKGLLFGALAGIASGALGVCVGQAFLFSTANFLQKRERNLTGVSLILATGMGWVLIGIFISMIEGLRSRSFRKLFVGLAGGIVGGILGGIMLQVTVITYPSNKIALLTGLVFFGFFLSFFYSFFENRFSYGSIKLLNGPLRNKEYHLVKSRIKIGSRNNCDIVLDEYRNVAPMHAFLQIKKGRVLLHAAGKSCPLLINDTLREESILRREDVFTVGSAKFMYGIFS